MAGISECETDNKANAPKQDKDANGHLDKAEQMKQTNGESKCRLYNDFDKCL